ncbi:hypothetical protein ACM55F_11600 [Flavobacterium sp. XS2P12]|uniref:hypothetical protein n=1 Tax=Flavobacterium melibiosi TaxID=3398734 RepID=UPI003A8B8E19
MNLTELYNSSLDDYLLIDGNWQKADFYTLATSSSFWNTAMVIVLSKEFAPTIDKALIYLLQKQAKALQIWEKEWNTTTPTLQSFIHFFIAEKGFTNSRGNPISIEDFWDKYSATIEGITAEPSFEFTKNDEPETFSELLNKEEITQVICFDDSWEEENYLIETETHWILYHWSSMV